MAAWVWGGVGALGASEDGLIHHALSSHDWLLETLWVESICLAASVDGGTQSTDVTLQFGHFAELDRAGFDLDFAITDDPSTE